MSWQVLLPVVPLRLSHLGYRPAEIGLLVGICSLTMAVVELQAGVIAAAIGRRWAILTGSAMNALCLAVAATSPARAVVAGFLAAVSASRGVLVPPLHATVADSVAAHMRGRAFGMFWLFTSLAALVGPAMGGLAAGRYGDRTPFLLAGAFTLAAMPLAAAQAVPGRAGRGASFREVASFMLDPSIARVGIMMILCFSLAGIWMTFLPLYVSQHGGSVAVIGWIFAIQGGMNVLMQVPTGRLVALHGGWWLAPAGAAAIAAVEIAVPLLHSTAMLLLAGACYGVAFGTMPVTFATLVTRGASSRQSTAAMSVYNCAIDLGLFAGPLVGAAAAQINLAGPFLLALPIGVLAVAFSPRAPRPVPAPATGGQ